MWITLQPDDLASRLSEAEYNALQSAATGIYGNTVPTVLADVVKEVRGRVAACARNTLGPEGTIPDELKAAALALARWRCLSRLPGMRALQDEARRAEYNDALALLADVARCSFAIVAPESPLPADLGGTLPSIGTKPLSFTRDQQSGA
jgi:hypothetical protein